MFPIPLAGKKKIKKTCNEILILTSARITSSLEQSYMNFKLKYFRAALAAAVSSFHLEKMRIIVLANILLTPIQPQKKMRNDTHRRCIHLLGDIILSYTAASIAQEEDKLLYGNPCKTEDALCSS